MDNIDDAKLFCFLSSSNRNLFEETKAISIPEKKAEKAKDQNMKIILSKIN